MKNYDYSGPGGYFITMCVKNRQRIFGGVGNGEMKVNRLGEIVVDCWNDIPKRYHDVRKDEFVVMPDHFHGIIIIENSTMVGSVTDGSSVADGNSVAAIQELPQPHVIRDQYELSRIRDCNSLTDSRKSNEVITGWKGMPSG